MCRCMHARTHANAFSFINKSFLCLIFMLQHNVAVDVVVDMLFTVDIVSLPLQ
jgi:hypothetical protein